MHINYTVMYERQFLLGNNSISKTTTYNIIYGTYIIRRTDVPSKRMADITMGVLDFIKKANKGRRIGPSHTY